MGLFGFPCGTLDGGWYTDPGYEVGSHAVCCGAEEIAQGLSLAARHHVGISSEVRVIVTGMDGQEHLLAGVVGELREVAVFAGESIVFVRPEVGEGAVEAEAVHARRREPVGRDAFFAVAVACAGHRVLNIQPASPSEKSPFRICVTGVSSNSVKARSSNQ